MNDNKKKKFDFPIDLNFYFGDEFPFDFEMEGLPFSRIYYYLNKIAEIKNMDVSTKGNIYLKIENASRRLLMMLIAKKKAKDSEFPARLNIGQIFDPLIGLYEIEALYHIEAMILFARTILDIFTYVSAYFLINLRIDSFTKFCKKVISSHDINLEPLKTKIEFIIYDKNSWIHVLSSISKRSLRDKIAHQTVIKLEYKETSETSDIVYCYINFNNKLIPLDKFLDGLCNGVIDFCLFIEQLIINKYNF
ncbi:hypothetical protein LCGC14_1042610 [marine sediment metagenome]|uniref:Cthe-2314-like HEPN domain-containing protein n=1 Tax=marine sediment metagenome TaxID=412755 RepID=A0A0F9QXK2_9ZZZZ